MKKTHKTGLLCLLMLIPTSPHTLHERYNHKTKRNNHYRRNNLNNIPTTIMKELPPKYIFRLKNIRKRDQENLILTYLDKKKNLDDIYVRFMFCLHPIDLQNTVSGIICLLALGSTVSAIALLCVEYYKFGWMFRPHIAFIDFILCCVVCSCSIIEYYRLPGLVKEHNEKTFETLLTQKGY